MPAGRWAPGGGGGGGHAALLLTLAVLLAAAAGGARAAGSATAKKSKDKMRLEPQHHMTTETTIASATAWPYMREFKAIIGKWRRRRRRKEKGGIGIMGGIMTAGL